MSTKNPESPGTATGVKTIDEKSIHALLTELVAAVQNLRSGSAIKEDLGEVVRHLDTTASQLVGMNQRLEQLVNAVKNAPAPGAGSNGYRTPTYRRALRVGESIPEVRGLDDRKLLAARADVQKDVTENKLPALLKNDFGGVTSVEKALDKHPGAKEALDAVKAAFIDRPNVDQTTRLLLTTPNVLAYEFLRVVQSGSPQFWDTLATVEAIRKGLQLHAEALYTALVKHYATERGWGDTAQQQIIKTLKTRYGQAVREVPNA